MQVLFQRSAFLLLLVQSICSPALTLDFNNRIQKNKSQRLQRTANRKGLGDTNDAMKVTHIPLRPDEFLQSQEGPLTSSRPYETKCHCQPPWWFHFLPIEQPFLASLASLTVSLQWEKDPKDNRMLWHPSYNRCLVKLIVKSLRVAVCWLTELHVNEQMSGNWNHLKDIFGDFADADIKRHVPVTSEWSNPRADWI